MLAFPVAANACWAPQYMIESEERRNLAGENASKIQVHLKRGLITPTSEETSQSPRVLPLEFELVQTSGTLEVGQKIWVVAPDSHCIQWVHPDAFYDDLIYGYVELKDSLHPEFLISQGGGRRNLDMIIELGADAKWLSMRLNNDR